MEERSSDEGGTAARGQLAATTDDVDEAQPEASAMSVQTQRRLLWNCQRKVKQRVKSDLRIAPTSCESQPEVESRWDLLSIELRCHLLSCLPAYDLLKMAMMSRKWNEAVHMHLQVRLTLSFTDEPSGALPAGLTDALLYSLLRRCPRLLTIRGFHFQHLMREMIENAVNGSHRFRPAHQKNTGILTPSGVVLALSQCPRLQGIEISDPALLQAISGALPAVEIVPGFRNRHGCLPRIPLNSFVLPPNVFTAAIELNSVTLPHLPNLVHVRSLRLQYVMFTGMAPFADCWLPALESFSMKFCAAPELDRTVHLVDPLGAHMDQHGYRPLFEALCAATKLDTLELIGVPFPGGMIQQLVHSQRAAGGGFLNLSRLVFGNCGSAMEDDLGLLALSSCTKLEHLVVQQSLARDTLFLSFAASRCALPSLIHLHLGYSEQRPLALGTQDFRDRRRRPIPFDIDRDRTHSPCLVTDDGLTRALGSVSFRGIKILTINESPHLHDARKWLAPVRHQLTELTLTHCHSLRLAEFEEGLAQMTALRHLRLAFIFRDPPKGCWHVGLTAGTGLGASAGPFGMAVGRPGQRISARAAASGASANADVRAQASSSQASTSYRACTCVRRARSHYVSCRSVKYRATQRHASTQVSNDELRSHSALSSGLPSTSQLNDASVCGLCPCCDGVWHARSRSASGLRDLPSSAAGSGKPSAAAKPGSGTGRPDGQRSTRLRQREQPSGSGAALALKEKGADDGPAAPAAVPMVNKCTGTSDPLPETDAGQTFVLRSSSLIALALYHVGITDLVLDSCPQMDNVSGFSCSALRKFVVNDSVARLSRAFFCDCPKLPARTVLAWSLAQRLPASVHTVFRSRVFGPLSVAMEHQLTDLEGFVEQNAVLNDENSAHVIVREHGPWNDAKRRLLLENSLCSLLALAGADNKRSVQQQQLTDGSTHEGDSPVGAHQTSSATRTMARGTARMAVRAAGRDGICYSSDPASGAVQVSYLHNLPPCCRCHRHMDLWGSRGSGNINVCDCEGVRTPSRHVNAITCTYLYQAPYRAEASETVE